MSYIGGAGALILEQQNQTGSWMNGFSSIVDPSLGAALGIGSSLVPLVDVSYDLGTKLKRFRTLHVSKINDDASGETLEIGNYSSDTGVTGVYGQLQGKGGSWKLSTTAGNGVLSGNGLTIGPTSGITYVNGSLSATGYVAQGGMVNVKAYGAIGDGTTDDTTAVQNAINYARTNGLPLRFPTGVYKITSGLNWTQWYGIEVTGSGSGNAGVAGTAACTKIVSTGITNVCHDFSGSSFGRVRGIAFTTSGGTPKVNVLLARVTGVTNNYGSDLTFEHCNFGGTSVATVASHSAEVLTFRDCRINANNGAPAFLFTTRLGSAPWSITQPSGLTLTATPSVTCIKFAGGEITGANTSLIYLDSPSQSGSDVAISDVYFAGQGSNMYALAINGNWDNVGVGRGTRFELTSLGSNYGFVNMVSGGLTDSQIQANPTSGTLASGTGNLNGCVLQSGAGITLTGNINGSAIISTNALNLTVTGNVVGTRAFVPSIGTLSVSGTQSLEVPDILYTSGSRTIRNAAGTRSITIQPGTTQFIDGSTDLYMRTGGNNTGGILTNNLYLGPNNNNACFTYIGQNPANSGAQTTTTTLGASFAGSTNTINIGKIAANDITTVLGTLSHTAEFVSVYLAANATLNAGTNVTNTWPSMTAFTSTNTRYLSWDDTAHAFKNSHPTLPMTVMIHASVEWGSSAGGRGIWVTWGSGPARAALRWWVAGDGSFSGSSCVVTIAANGGTVSPVVFCNSGSEVMNGSGTAGTNRCTLQAAILC